VSIAGVNRLTVASRRSRDRGHAAPALAGWGAVVWVALVVWAFDVLVRGARIACRRP
jgi:hypothetical protein